MNHSTLRGLALLLTAAPLAVAAPVPPDPNGFFFRPGERIVFIGDSITDQYQYSVVPYFRCTAG